MTGCISFTALLLALKTEVCVCVCVTGTKEYHRKKVRKSQMSQRERACRQHFTIKGGIFDLHAIVLKVRPHSRERPTIARM